MNDLVAHRGTTTLSLGELVRALARYEPELVGDAATKVADVRHDSRAVVPGDVFVARPGMRSDGLMHCSDAVARGARAVITGKGHSAVELGVPIVSVTDPAAALSVSAEVLNGWPCRELEVVGVTGTNGKTTIAWLIQQALGRMGRRAARIGTLGLEFPGLSAECGLTTPEADDISRFARGVVEQGGQYLVMEASSIALVQRRVEAIRFGVALFTNLTQDHLDFHGTMEAYGAAKLRLFVDFEPRAAVINVDDPFGGLIAHKTRASRVIRVGCSPSSRADLRPVAVRCDGQGIRGTVELWGKHIELESRLVGAHNLENLLGALGAVEALGLDVTAAARALGEVGAAAGRLERCDEASDDVVVLVDYSHTPDALVRALDAVRALTMGRVHCVFGCGGNRDPGKRPKMGAAVAASADVAYLTNDNPRSEAPEAIAAAVEPALSAAGVRYVVELDRARAIELAVLDADPGDVVLVAGKGHEDYQIFADRTIHFDDREECRRALRIRRGRRGA